jgi:dihydrofolate synthase/folylpolyglutamate synthase
LNTTPSPNTLEAWLELLETRHPQAVDLGLERCRAVWQRMGSPRPARSIFVVAGTNGKGSTVATICGLLDGLGYRYGSYTTPHLHRYNERVQLLGQPVSDEQLLAAFERVEAALHGTSLTYFEFGTLAAFQILATAGLDYAVLEVGLGGRLDAVNLVDADVAVITPIGLDHQEYLGTDLDSIGREKAGIIRPGRPVVCGEENPPPSVLAVAAGQGAPLRRLGVDFRVSAAGTGVCYAANGVELQLPRPALRGPHQLDNLATALSAVLQCIPAAAHDLAGLQRGLRSVRVPGRFERISGRFGRSGGAKGQGPVVWIDVGHNPLAAGAVAAALEEVKAAGEVRNCRCVLGMLADKDAGGTVRELRKVISQWYCASLPGGRGQSAEQLAGRIGDAAGPAPLRTFDRVETALDAALADSAPHDGVLVFGSFLTAAAARSHVVTR